MKRIIVLVLCAVLLLSAVSCVKQEAKEQEIETKEKETELKETEKQEKEPLTVEHIVDFIHANGDFSCLIQTDASIEKSEKELNCDISQIYFLKNQEPETDEWIAICTLYNEEDAERVDEARNYLVGQRYGINGCIRRYGTIVMYGNSDIILRFNHRSYADPISDERVEKSEPDPLSFEGIIAFIEKNSSLSGGYADSHMLKELNESKSGYGGELINYASLEAYENDKKTSVHVCEFSEGSSYADEVFSHFDSFRGQGVYSAKIGDIVVYGDSSVIDKLLEE